MDSSMFISQDI